jgi:3',5'-cyclic AMP phosphodiesterase CpdA
MPFDRRQLLRHSLTLLPALALPASGSRGAPTSAAASAPGTLPARVLLSWPGDPATTQAVTWLAPAAATTAQGQIAPQNAHPDFDKQAATVAGTATGNGHYAVAFTGLKPATRYLYRVGDGKAWSEWSSFLTASTKAEPFRFLYVGDAQNDIRSKWSRAIRAAYAAAPDARFLASAGDLLQDGYKDQLWEEWCDSLGWMGETLPQLPVPGNHDLHRAPDAADAKSVLSVSPLWAQHFQLPANGPAAPEMRSQSYTLDYQGVRFVVVDVNVFSNESFDASAKQRVWDSELAWLDQVLKDKGDRWLIVMQHQPIYAMAKGRDYDEMRAVLAPRYEKAGVDLVLQGHDHHYSRSHKVNGGRVVAPDAPGIVYAISVSGPKMYEVENRHRELMAHIVEQTQCFQVIDVAPDRLGYAAWSADGAVIDRFELRRAGAATRYVNIDPAGASAR